MSVANTATFSFGDVQPPAEARHGVVAAQWSQVILLDLGLGDPQIPSIQRLLTLLNLPENWDSYGSPPPSEAAIMMGVAIVGGLASVGLDYLTAPLINAVSGGGVLLQWRSNSRELELEILSSGSVRYLKVESSEPIDENTVNHPMFSQLQPLFAWLTS